VHAVAEGLDRHPVRRQRGLDPPLDRVQHPRADQAAGHAALVGDHEQGEAGAGQGHDPLDRPRQPGEGVAAAHVVVVGRALVERAVAVQEDGRAWLRA